MIRTHRVVGLRKPDRPPGFAGDFAEVIPAARRDRRGWPFFPSHRRRSPITARTSGAPAPSAESRRCVEERRVVFGSRLRYRSKAGNRGMVVLRSPPSTGNLYTFRWVTYGTFRRRHRLWLRASDKRHDNKHWGRCGSGGRKQRRSWVRCSNGPPSWCSRREVRGRAIRRSRSVDGD